MKKTPPETPARRPAICVFCGSSHGKDPAYTAAAQRFGELLVEAGFELVFGGGGVGLMGEVAASVAKRGGRILGVVPSFLRHLEPPLEVNSTIVITDSMNDRKAKMFEAADAFAILPGGPGTLDEFAEALTNAQLSLHDKPIVIVNVKNYYAPMLALIDQFIAHGFARPALRDLFQVVDTPEEAIKILAARLRIPTGRRKTEK
jgi:uncharacterized protein (TIGR00730 family)